MFKEVDLLTTYKIFEAHIRNIVYNSVILELLILIKYHHPPVHPILKYTYCHSIEVFLAFLVHMDDLFHSKIIFNIHFVQE